MQQFDSQSDMLNAIRQYCQRDLAGYCSAIDQSDTISESIYRSLVDFRLFAFERVHDHADELDSLGRTELLFQCLSTIAEVSPSVAKAVMDQNFGQIGMMREFGNDGILQRLGDIRRGEKQAAFLMTEPQSGSDLSQFETTFEQVIDGFVLNGTKDWITGASRREYFVVLAKEKDTAKNFALFFVDRSESSSSIKICDRKNKLGLRGLGEFRVELNNVFVPNDCVVIPPGSGAIRKVMAHYNLKRCGQAAIALGTTRAALRVAYDYLQVRFKGGIPFQNTEFIFADLYSRYVAAKELPIVAAKAIIAGESTGVSASVAKYVCTELAVEVTTKLAQLCGGNGFSDKLPLERLMRDMRMLTVAGGASQVLQANVARNLGQLLHAHHH